MSEDSITNEASTAKRALVTGATGFIGSRLVAHLAQAGWEVAAIGRNASAAKIARAQCPMVYEYSGQTAEVIAAVTDFRPAVVFHLASLFLADHTAEQIEPLVSANILFGTQLLEAIRGAGCTVLVNAGTAWQNFTPEPPYDDAAYAPVNLYAATKQAFEEIALYYVQVAGMRMITLRLFDSYGAGDTRRKLLRLLLECLRTGEPLSMSPGEQVLDLVHVDDICRAFLHAAELAGNETGARVYAVSGGERRTLREVARTLEEAAGATLKLEFGGRPYRAREVMHPWDGPALPGWSPRISLLEGFRSLLREEKAAQGEADA